MQKHSAALTFYQQNAIVIAGFRNIGFVYWGAQATTASVRTVAAMAADLRTRQSKISVIQVIPHDAALPTEEARELLLKMTESGGHTLGCVVYVMSGEGFWASTMRSYLTNVHWVRQRPFVPRIAATFEEVASFMPPIHRERTGVDVPAAELLEMMKACMNGRPYA